VLPLNFSDMKKNLLIFLFLGIFFTTTASGQEIEVTLSIYNPTPGQCDKDHLITASGDKIDLKKLRAGQLNWIAFSRDLLKSGDWGYGDIVEVISDNKKIAGIYIIKDTMGKRWRKKVDILRDRSSGLTGVYKVRVRMVKRADRKKGK